jgi:3-hydroxyisobutyrate dehydrogenase
MKVGFIGLGTMGAPMARAIAEGGSPLTVWARRPETLDTFRTMPNATTVDSIEEVGLASDLVGICVGNDADVKEVVVGKGLLESMSPETVVAIHSTVSPATCRELAREGEEWGVSILDAPVSGGSARAETKTLTTMVGGDPAAYERCRPVFETFSSFVSHLGPSGVGQLAKLINNVLFAANIKNAVGTIKLAEQLGFDVGNLVELIRASSGASFGLEALAQQLTADNVGIYQSMIQKDVDNFSQAAREMSIPRSSLEEAAAAGLEEMPSAVQKLAR